MLASELITQIRAELLEPVAGFWSDAELLGWINAGERDFFNKVRSVETSSTASTEAGRPNYPLPDNWLSALAVFYNDEAVDGRDSWKRLTPTSLEKVSQEVPNFLSVETADQGVPAQYWIFNNEMWVNPVPNATGKQIKMFHKAKAVPLAATSSSLNVDDSLSQAIKSYVLWMAWSKEKELQLAVDQRDMYKEYVMEGRKWMKKRTGDMVHQIDVRSGMPYTGSGVSASPSGINWR